MIATRQSVDSVLAECSTRGIAFTVHHGRLRAYPPDAIDDALLTAIRHHKRAIISQLTEASLQARQPHRWTSNDWCQYGHPEGWRSIYGPHLICATCHPPSREEAVAERIKA